MKKINLGKDQFVLVDNEDFKRLNQWKWHLNDKGYAVRRITIKIQNEIIKLNGNYCIDHKDRNKLNNQKSNLRTVTRAENMQNRGKVIARKGKITSSKYVGVTWDKFTNSWAVRIKGKHIDRFKDEIEAAKAYDSEAKKLYGEFAYINFK